MALSAVVPIALASDTVSIAIMEIVDNALMLLIPGAMDAGLDGPALLGQPRARAGIAGAAAYPVNRWLIAAARGTRSCTSTTTRTEPTAFQRLASGRREAVPISQPAARDTPGGQP